MDTATLGTFTRRRALLAAGIAALVLTGASCYHPALVSPEPMRAGDLALGLAGTVIPRRDMPVGTLTWQGRVGLGHGWDAGLRLTIPSGPYADIKWNFLARPFLLTADLGGFYQSIREDDMTEHFISDTLAYGVCPALLVGTRTAYAGIRASIRRGFGHKMSNNVLGWTLSPSLLLGASIGDRLRLMPVTELIWSDRTAYFYVGLNLEGHLRSREESVDW